MGCFNSPVLFSQELKNPLTLSNEWVGYSIGDPYVLKHKGIFYLYCSTKDAETGIKCWSSKDLLKWKYEGLCSTSTVTKGAYAPEVVYRNGKFYLFTSPGGNGHYILTSDSPAGPFVPATSNLGRAIDGSGFTDDDGTMYFFHASTEGIIGCIMPDPLSFGAELNLNARMNNWWTEGPCMFKRNGFYYLIYTGNHLLSKGYRIDYAISDKGPLSSFTPAASQNPILIDALGLHTGLGHGSIFIGPDLDSYYLTYHNLVNQNGPFRRLNFDRIAWNGNKLIVLGPTDFIQQNPSMPDGYDFLERSGLGTGWTTPDGGLWKMNGRGSLLQDTIIPDDRTPFTAIFNGVAGSINYTAEFNLREIDPAGENSRTGAIFSYTGPADHGMALLNSTDGKLEINLITDNTPAGSFVADLPADFDFKAWHCIRIEKFNIRYRVFIDGMQKLLFDHYLPAGRTGYVSIQSKSEFGYIALSNLVNGSGTFDIFKPVPGKIPAIQYNSGGPDTGFHCSKYSGTAGTLVRTDEPGLISSPHGGYALSSIRDGDWFNYNINAEGTGLYNLEIIYSSWQQENSIQVGIDGGTNEASHELPNTKGEFKSWVIKDISLPEGFHTFKLEIRKGLVDLYSLEFTAADNKTFDKMVSFDGSFGSGWKYEDGGWQIVDRNACIDGTGKRLYGSEGWRDFTIEADIMFKRNINAGLIFRVKNPALGGEGNDPVAGTDFFQGYYAGFSYGSIILGKMNYGWQLLTTASMQVKMNTWYHVRAIVSYDRIRIYADDMSKPIIEYIDPHPLIGGLAGLRSFNSGVCFDNFHVTSDIMTSTGNSIPAGNQVDWSLFPNPAGEYVHLRFANAGTRRITISDPQGKRLVEMTACETEPLIMTGILPIGIYLVSVDDGNSRTFEKLVKLN